MIWQKMFTVNQFLKRRKAKQIFYEKVIPLSRNFRLEYIPSTEILDTHDQIFSKTL